MNESNNFPLYSYHLIIVSLYNTCTSLHYRTFALLFGNKSYQCLLIVFILFSFIKWCVPFSARISFRRLQTTDVPTLVAADLQLTDLKIHFLFQTSELRIYCYKTRLVYINIRKIGMPFYLCMQSICACNFKVNQFIFV